MIYVIAVELEDPARNEKAIDGWIRETYDSWTNPIERLWIVDGAFVADQIYTGLEPLLGPADKLVIVKGSMEAVWQGVSSSSAAWLADNFPGSWSERIPGKTEGLQDRG